MYVFNFASGCLHKRRATECEIRSEQSTARQHTVGFLGAYKATEHNLKPGCLTKMVRWTGIIRPARYIHQALRQ
eukprot:scaffold8768_cov16-Prasinocladus_malaysianus.AAC.1